MNWHEYFFEMAALAAKKSKDKSTQCGAVIVGPAHEIRSTGYNSFPRGLNDDVEERHARPLKYKWMEHAERNAIYNAARIGVSLHGCTIYQDWLPCCDCARAIIQSGIERLIINGGSSKNGDKEWEERWGESLAVSTEMMQEAKINIYIYNPQTKSISTYLPFKKKT